jgi:AmiR/NasT family two-component response regulator
VGCSLNSKKAIRFGWLWCPKWDLNPHCTRFELALSAELEYWGWFVRFACSASEDGGPSTVESRLTSIAGPTVSILADLCNLVYVTRTQSRVVIAEDEALIRLDLKEMLEEDGYAVVGEAGDGEAAIRLAQELRPDLVITDIKMPVLDGLSAAERIAGERIAPVVILTAFSQRELVERARQAGAMAYLVKPFSKSDLVPAIEMATSRYAELAALEAEVGSLQDRLETRKLVEQAKGLLQSNHGMSEPEAFRWIQKNSMDRRLTMRKVAETVVETLGAK